MDAKQREGGVSEFDVLYAPTGFSPLSDAQLQRALPNTFAENRARATMRGYATVHAYFAWKTQLKSDYAAALRIPDRGPATYLPLMNAFRTATRTAPAEGT